MAHDMRCCEVASKQRTHFDTVGSRNVALLVSEGGYERRYKQLENVIFR